MATLLQVQPVQGPSRRSERTAPQWRRRNAAVTTAVAVIGPWVLSATPSEGWAMTPPRFAPPTGRQSSTLLSPPLRRFWLGRSLDNSMDLSGAFSYSRLCATDREDRVSVVSSPESSTENPLDSLLSWLVSPEGAIAVGCTGLLSLLIGPIVFGGWWDNNKADPNAEVRWAGIATRSNLLAVMACGAALASAIGQLDVEAVSADEVLLEGEAVPQPIGPKATQVGWFLNAALAATPAATVVLLTLADVDDNASSTTVASSSRWSVAAAAGLVPLGGIQQPPLDTPVLDRYSPGPGSSRLFPDDRETYLPKLQALPGRVEFTVNSYLPSNTQAALLVPVPLSGVAHASAAAAVLVLGSNRARSFTPRDIGWGTTLATRLATVIEPEPV